MAQEYGAAQPIADWVKDYIVKPVETVMGIADKVPSHEKEDTSWHDQKVSEANESFRKRGTALKSTGTKSDQKKKC